MSSSSWSTSLIEVQIQAGAAKEAVGFEQFGLIGDQLGRAAAGHRPGKEHLRRPVEGVHEAQAIQARRANWWPRCAARRFRRGRRKIRRRACLRWSGFMLDEDLAGAARWARGRPHSQTAGKQRADAAAWH